MRLKRPRLRLRTGMALVAVAASLMGWALHRRRGEEYARLAERYRAEEKGHAETAELIRKEQIMPRLSREQTLIGVAFHRRQASHHRQLRDKYEAAAARPWLPVEPDPPPPD
jgi:hypothetical protein